jgi:hypothetical protein
MQIVRQISSSENSSAKFLLAAEKSANSEESWLIAHIMRYTIQYEQARSTLHTFCSAIALRSCCCWIQALCAAIWLAWPMPGLRGFSFSPSRSSRALDDTRHKSKRLGTCPDTYPCCKSQRLLKILHKLRFYTLLYSRALCKGTNFIIYYVL